MLSEKRQAYLFLLSASILAALGPAMFMKFVETFDILSGILWLLLFGGIGSLAFCFIERKKEPDGSQELSKRGFAIWIFFVSLLWPASFLLYAYAMTLGTVTETGILTRVGPLLSILFAVIFLGEKIQSWGKMTIAVMVCFIGIASSLTKSEGAENAWIDVDIWFLCCVIFSATFTSARQTILSYLQKMSRAKKLFSVGLSLLLGSLIAFAIFGGAGRMIQIPDFVEVSCLMFLGCGTVVVPMVLTLRAYGIFKSQSKIALWDYLTPVFIGLFAALINGEYSKLNYGGLAVGLALISVGVFWADKSVGQQKPKG